MSSPHSLSPLALDIQEEHSDSHSIPRSEQSPEPRRQGQSIVQFLERREQGAKDDIHDARRRSGSTQSATEAAPNETQHILMDGTERRAVEEKQVSMQVERQKQVNLRAAQFLHHSMQNAVGRNHAQERQASTQKQHAANEEAMAEASTGQGMHNMFPTSANPGASIARTDHPDDQWSRNQRRFCSEQLMKDPDLLAMRNIAVNERAKSQAAQQAREPRLAETLQQQPQASTAPAPPMYHFWACCQCEKLPLVVSAWDVTLYSACLMPDCHHVRCGSCLVKPVVMTEDHPGLLDKNDS